MIWGARIAWTCDGKQERTQRQGWNVEAVVFASQLPWAGWGFIDGDAGCKDIFLWSPEHLELGQGIQHPAATDDGKIYNRPWICCGRPCIQCIRPSKFKSRCRVHVSFSRLFTQRLLFSATRFILWPDFSSLFNPPHLVLSFGGCWGMRNTLCQHGYVGNWRCGSQHVTTIDEHPQLPAISAPNYGQGEASKLLDRWWPENEFREVTLWWNLHLMRS